MFSYVAYGLGIQSAVPLPELVSGSGSHDVLVRFGRADRTRENAEERQELVCVSRQETRLFWEDVGAFQVRRGQEIIVDPAPNVDPQVLRSFLLGSAMAVLLHQRGLLVLHGSAIAAGGEAVAFLGGSGWGKSTIAGAMHALGYEIIADDVVAVNAADQGRPGVLFGFPQLKLWPKALAALGKLRENFSCLHPRSQKLACHIASGAAPTRYPLRRIYVLGTSSIRQGIEVLSPQEGLVELIRHTYVLSLLQPTNTSGLHLQQCARIANCVPILRLNRGRSLGKVFNLARLVEMDLAGARQEAAILQLR